MRVEDFTPSEVNYLHKRFKTFYFNCHENSFDYFYKKFKEFRKNIVLELNYNNIIENKTEPNKAGGFCIDLAHFTAARDLKKIEYDYVMNHAKNTKFHANHLNGYSKKRKRDLHFITNKNQFDFLKNLPKQIFSTDIALELENKIETQLKFKKYIATMLNKKFNIK
ncbi:hypothetical protein HN587_00995 [Candidatus Woesearchaeota archaeon]|jgi:hypothetical protein|nr:hypothetical protein [Candidatus Woesearchaeota archaeon]